MSITNKLLKRALFLAALDAGMVSLDLGSDPNGEWTEALTKKMKDAGMNPDIYFDMLKGSLAKPTAKVSIRSEKWVRDQISKATFYDNASVGEVRPLPIVKVRIRKPLASADFSKLQHTTLGLVSVFPVNEDNTFRGVGSVIGVGCANDVHGINFNVKDQMTPDYHQLVSTEATQWLEEAFDENLRV